MSEIKKGLKGRTTYSIEFKLKAVKSYLEDGNGYTCNQR